MVCSNGVCSFEKSHVSFLLKSNDLGINLHQLSFYLLERSFKLVFGN